MHVAATTYRRLTLFALLSLMVIVVTGATVRLTGSGLGCTDWPTCEHGQLAAQANDAPAMVEFGNRVFTGVVSVAVILAVLGAIRRRPRRADLTWLALGLVAGVIAQIILGGLVVNHHLSPKFVMGHFMLSMALITDAAVLHVRAGRPDGEAVVRTGDELTRGLARLVPVVAAITVFLGTVVTAAGPHAGDQRAARLNLVVGDVARVHSIAAWLTVLVTVALLRAARRDARVRRAAEVLAATLVAQGVVGYVQYFTGVPAALVLVHVAGATAMWWAATNVALSVNTTPTLVRSGHGAARTFAGSR
ncbi:MAG: heme a synthase [Actinomycetota bacterium]|nr:heme a synthase [Actinomycetota bacterium]